ncbi:hypothetical protein ACVWWR_005894 [Bradyrhizobium sp. LM3.2]
MPDFPTLAKLAEDLESGRTTSRKLVEACIARIADPAGEGQRAFIHVDKDAALAAADAMDGLRKVKAAPSRYAGIPVSIKDLFDIKGQVTRAGSRALDDSSPAEQDAPTVARLRKAGFVVIGRTNMTEFAYSGIGINPHYGTPKGAWNRAEGHVPGGSSSGAPRCPCSTAWRTARSALIPAAPAAFRRPITASSATSRRSAACRSTGLCRCRSRLTASGRWHDRSVAVPYSTPCSRTSRSLR